MQLTNVKVVEVKKGTDGTKDGRHWTLYKLKLSGETEPYGLFRGDYQPVPIVGDKIAYAEYDEKPNGKYKNPTIQKLVMAEPDPGLEEPKQEPPAPAPQTPVPPMAKPNGNDVPRSMLLSYIKDIQVVRIQTSPVLADTPLAVLWKEVEDVANGKEIPF